LGLIISIDLVERRECPLPLEAKVPQNGRYYGVLLTCWPARATLAEHIPRSAYGSLLTGELSSLSNR
jgi:hypothetical protein